MGDTCVGGLQLYSERYSCTGVFQWILRNFKNNYYVEHLWTPASENRAKKRFLKQLSFVDCKNSVPLNRGAGADLLYQEYYL